MLIRLRDLDVLDEPLEAPVGIALDRRSSSGTAPSPADPDRPGSELDRAAAARTLPYGSRQSTGCAPCRSSRSLARLNGREPKKPRSADIGEG